MYVALTLLVSTLSHAQTPTILVFGDSISAGYGIPEGKEWVALLRQNLTTKTSVINASISGETTVGGLSRIDDALERHTPNVVVLELGGNDGLRGFPLQTMQNNLAKMIEKSLAANAQVVLLGMRIPPNYGPRYSEAFFNTYRKLAEQYDVIYVPFFLENVGGNASLVQRDGIHPNTEAQPLLLANALPAIRAALGNE